METEEFIQAQEAKLEQMWDKIQELKEKDLFAAQIMYKKYQQMQAELPPPIPS